jgi:hypothetical protein
MAAAFVSMTDSITSFPLASLTAMEGAHGNVCLPTHVSLAGTRPDQRHREHRRQIAHVLEISLSELFRGSGESERAGDEGEVEGVAWAVIAIGSQHAERGSR